MSDRELIKRLGGPKAVAEQLGFPLPKGTARVANWMRRGIPAKIKLNNLNLFVIRTDTAEAKKDQ